MTSGVGVVAVLAFALTGVLAGAGPAGASAGAPSTGSPSASVPSAPPVPPAAIAPKGGVRPLIYPDGGIPSFGDAAPMGAPLAGMSLNAPLVAMASLTEHPGAQTGTGVWLAAADGGVFALGHAAFYGSAGSLPLVGPIVGMAATHDDLGYWLVAMDGGIFSYGDAQFYGSMGGHPLNQPIVGMASTDDGKGYWLVASDGGVFAFGDAQFDGSMGGKPLNSPIVGMAALPTGNGYWLVAGDGGIFTFGTAKFYGSAAGVTLQSGISSMAASPTGRGYWLLESDGTVFHYGTALALTYPTGTPAAAPYAAIAPSLDGKGYWLLEPDGFDYSFAHPAPTAGFPGIVAAAASQIAPDPDGGYFCNPYGPCEEWCALFATWTWEDAGIDIPSYAFTGDIYYWAAAHGAVLPPTATPVPGDAVLYGTGPWTVTSSVHVGIVAQVWPDGAIDTVEGDAGPSVAGHLAVVVNGPYLPADSIVYNGFGIYAFAQP